MEAERCVSSWSSGCGDEHNHFLRNCVTAITSCGDAKIGGGAGGGGGGGYDPLSSLAPGGAGGMVGDSPNALLSRAAFNPFVVVAGYGDGELRLFDTRMPSIGTRNVVAAWHEHESWILNAHMSSDHGIISASIDGHVKFFDLRASEAVRTLETLAPEPGKQAHHGGHGYHSQPHHGGGDGGRQRSHSHQPYQSQQLSSYAASSARAGAAPSPPPFEDDGLGEFAPSGPANMTAMAVHPCAPIIATGSYAQFIKVMTLDGIVLKTIKYHQGFMGQRIGPVSCLAFHPHRAVFAAGATDSIVSVYSSSRGAVDRTK